MNWKEGDVFYWPWNEYELKRRSIEQYKQLLEDKSYESMQSIGYEKDVGIFDDDYLDYEE